MIPFNKDLGYNRISLISTKPGRKGPKDEIIFYHDTPITLREFGEIFSLLCKNEDEIYPKPKFKGSEMLMDYLKDIKTSGGLTSEIIRKYKL